MLVFDNHFKATLTQELQLLFPGKDPARILQGLTAAWQAEMQQLKHFFTLFHIKYLPAPQKETITSAQSRLL